MAGKAFDEARRARLCGLIEAGSSLEEAAARVGVTRQTVFRWQARGKVEQDTPAAVFAAHLAAARGESDDADIATEEEVLRMLTRAARKGSVTAMRAIVAHHRAERGQVPQIGNPFENLDELAKRRGKRG